MPVFVCSISGITPLLMHRWTELAEQEATTRTIHIERRDPRTEAERACYRREDGSIYFPGTAIARMLREAGSAHKQRGSRRSLRFVIPASCMIVEEAITLKDARGEPLSDFEVDSRPVTIPSTKGRIMRHRPRFDTWGAEFSVDINSQLIDPDTVHQLLAEGGNRIGLLEFRPDRGGPYGRFAIVSWKELADRADAGMPSRHRPKLTVAD